MMMRTIALGLLGLGALALCSAAPKKNMNVLVSERFGISPPARSISSNLTPVSTVFVSFLDSSS
jgi:hypothetical protein